MRYDFECNNPECKKVFELDVRLADFEKEQFCPECNTLATRLITLVAPKDVSWSLWRVGSGKR